MNVVFWLLLVLSIILVWAMLAFAFHPVGRFLCELWEDVTEAMDLYDEKRKDNEDE